MSDIKNEKRILNELLGLFKSKQYAEVEKKALSYIKSFPENPALYNLIGASQNYLGKYNEAIIFFKKTCDLQPNIAENFVNVGTALKDVGKDYEAINYFEKSLSIDPNNAIVLAQTGYLCTRNFIPEKAKKYLEKAIKLDPKPEFIFNLGEAFKQLGDKENASKNFLKALKIKPDMKQANYKLALLFQDKKNYKKSIHHFQKCMKYRDTEERYLFSLYLDGQFKEFNEEFKKISVLKDSSVLMQMISSHASKYLNKKDEYNFSNNPFDSIYHENLSELKKGSYLLMKILQDLNSPDIEHRHQDLLTNGIQTNGNIFDLPIESIQNLKKLIIREIYRFKEKNSVFKNNMIKKWPKKSILNGWLIRMNSEGFLMPHIHENGWLSGSIYLSIPEDIEDNEGCIEFSFEGKDFPILDDKGPKKLIKLETGDIILFPSSLAHSTTPFKSNKKRICVAFDLNPL